MDMGTQIAAKQFLEAVMSIGANIEEADGAETPKDRIYKWSLSRKEAREARYWNRVICAVTDPSPEGEAIQQECLQLVKILSVLINKGKRSVAST